MTTATEVTYDLGDEGEQVRVLEDAEVDVSDEGKERGFAGLAVPYGKPGPIVVRINGHQTPAEEVMAPGVFTKSIKEAAKNLPLLINHRKDELPIGRSVEWDERPDGLHARWVLNDHHPDADKVHGMIKDRFLTGLSVGFIPKVSAVTAGAPPSTLPQVTRRQGRLFEVSAVTVPTFAEAVIEHTLSRGVQVLEVVDPAILAWREYLRSIS